MLVSQLRANIEERERRRGSVVPEGGNNNHIARLPFEPITAIALSATGVVEREGGEGGGQREAVSSRRTERERERKRERERERGREASNREEAANRDASRG